MSENRLKCGFLFLPRQPDLHLGSFPGSAGVGEAVAGAVENLEADVDGNMFFLPGNGADAVLFA